MKLLLLLLVLAGPALAQPARRIPDAALRRLLTRQGFLTNGVLNDKSRRWDQLYISGEGIKDLEGIQYFTNVTWLTIRDTKLLALMRLPPRLKYLDCPRNALLTLPKLPPGLVALDCSGNRLTRLPKLPATLELLQCSNNRLAALPLLPERLQYLSYAQNPGLKSTLGPAFRAMPCVAPRQNCLPNSLRKWNILNASIKDTSSALSSLKVEIKVHNSWGLGSEEHTVNFRHTGDQLIADRMQVHKVAPGHGARLGVASTQLLQVNYTVSQSFIRQVIKDINAKKLVFEASSDGYGQVLNLTNKRIEQSSYVNCSDCSVFSIRYVLYYSPSDSTSLSYQFDSMLNGGPLTSPPAPQVKTALLDWLYMYKLTNATVPDNETVRQFFKPQYLRNVLQWAQ